jgi:hypothetical protein
MSKHFPLIMGSTALCMLFVLGGCGTGGASQPGTPTGGSVTVRTEHATYRPADTIQVSVTNSLQTGIFAYDTLASCTILGLQAQVNGSWQNSKIAYCALGRRARLVEIAAGKTYQATVRAGISRVQSPGFPPGTYRFSLLYMTSAQEPVQDRTTIYSAPFTIA